MSLGAGTRSPTQPSGSRMLSVTRIDLPPDARAVLETYVAAALPAGGWGRLTSRLFPGQRRVLEQRAAKAAAVLAVGACDEVRLLHGVLPVTTTHEHGLLILAPVADHATLMLDIASVADDPRWELHRAGRLMRTSWRWLRFSDLDGPFGFEADGEPIEPRVLPDFHGTALESRLTGGAGWPGDDVILQLGMPEIIRLAGLPGDS